MNAEHLNSSSLGAWRHLLPVQNAILLAPTNDEDPADVFVDLAAQSRLFSGNIRGPQERE
jgi:hypothetical protein